MEGHRARDRFQLTLSSNELSMLQNAINETLEALDEEEFQTRTGHEVADYHRLLDKLKTVRRS